MKAYYFGWTHKDILAHGTEKAFYVTYAESYSGAGDSYLWIPRSICITEEPNEYGNLKIFIPVWFFKNNHKDFSRIRDISYGESGVDAYIKR